MEYAKLELPLIIGDSTLWRSRFGASSRLLALLSFDFAKLVIGRPEMPWDAWALLSIIVLCTAVIALTARDSYRVSHDHPQTTLRLSLSGGGHLEIPCPPPHPTGRHRRPHPIR